MCELLAREPQIQVVGQARDGLEAVALARELRPDLITMDVFMPGIDGLEAARRIMAEFPSRILVVTSASDRELDLAMRSLEAGALELIPKPHHVDAAGLATWGRSLAHTVKIMSEVPVVRRRTPVPFAAPRPSPEARLRSIDAVAIVASTGGP